MKEGSQRSAGCGQVKRADRHAGWRFLISTGPLLHFLEHDAVFCRGEVRQVEKAECNTCCLSSLTQPLICLHLSCVFRGKKHSLDSMSVWSLQGNQSHQMSIHEDELHLSRKHSKYFCICAGHGGIVEAFALLSVTKSHWRLKPTVCRSVG